MIKKLNNKLIGKRLVLKKATPDILLAKMIFKEISLNRRHLRPYMAWEKATLRVEDTLKFLLETEEAYRLGSKINYGVFLNNKYIGNIGAFDINEKNRSLEIGYWLSQKYTGKGYMTEALQILENEIFKNTKINRIQIKCDSRNIASSKVAEKCGYKLEGIIRQDKYSSYFKDLRNTMIYSKLKSEYRLKK